MVLLALLGPSPSLMACACTAHKCTLTWATFSLVALERRHTDKKKTSLSIHRSCLLPLVLSLACWHAPALGTVLLGTLCLFRG